jgi:hypothetical protein
MAASVNEFHMAKGDARFIEGTSVMAMSAMVIVTVLVAWAIGGTEFKDEFYGNVALVVASIGFVVGAILEFSGQKLRHPK